MEGVLGVRLPVEPIKHRLGIAMIVNRSKFGRIEKTATPPAVQRDEISPPSRPDSKSQILGPVSERAVIRGQTAEGFPPAESRLRCHVDDEAGLVPEFGWWRSG